MFVITVCSKAKAYYPHSTKKMGAQRALPISLLISIYSNTPFLKQLGHYFCLANTSTKCAESFILKLIRRLLMSHFSRLLFRVLSFKCYFISDFEYMVNHFFKTDLGRNVSGE